MQLAKALLRAAGDMVFFFPSSISTPFVVPYPLIRVVTAAFTNIFTFLECT